MPNLHLYRLSTALLAAALQLSALPQLTTPRQILALSNDEANNHYPISMRAVVTLYDPARWVFFLQSGEDAVFALSEPSHPLNIHSGDLVEVQGYTTAGGYAPVVSPRSVRVIGHPGLPRPHRMSEIEMETGLFENVYGEAPARLLSVQIGRGAREEPLHIALEFQMGKVIAHASARLDLLPKFTEIINADLLVRGIYGSDCNGQGRRRGPWIMLGDFADIVVTARHPIDWDAAPSGTIAGLLRYRGSARRVDIGTARPVRITGVVTYFNGDHRYYLQDGANGIAVDSALPANHRVGETLEALGELEWERWGSLHLAGAILRSVSQRPPPEPFLSGSEELDFREHESGLLAIPGRVLDRRRLPGKDLLVLADVSGSIITAELPASSASDQQLFNHCQLGDTVRATGVLELDWPLGTGHIRARRVLLRSSSDVEVIARQPWLARVPWIRVAFTGVAFIAAVLLWVHLLRKRVRRQTADLAAQSVALEEAMKAAQSANRAKSDFLANMSHEIRTPLNGVLGMTELALLEPASAEQRDYLETARDSAHSLLNVLNDILDFSKIESRKLELESVTFSLADVANSALRTMSVRAAEKGLQQQLTLAPGLPPSVTGDPYRLKQVLLNLLSNGIKFTPSGSVNLHILPAANGHISFEVSDTGIGIPPDKLPLLFQPFSQADVSTTRRFGGSGLGLAISAQLVELMNGKMECESEPNKGSTFRFTIPLSEAAAEQSTPASSAKRSGPRALRVLVAEDHPVNQKLIQRLLEKRGHMVRTAADGREAVAMASSQDFDVILMDVQMPLMDGYDATRLIRKVQASQSRRVPILALTANALNGDRESCLAAGMDGFLPKPVSADLLWASVESYGSAKSADILQ